MAKSKSKVKFNVRDMVADLLIKGLEKGRIPWNRPWDLSKSTKGNSQLVPVNHNSGRTYSGMNFMLLEAGEYITFKKIKEAGYTLKKGTKSEIAVFWTFIERLVDEIKGGKPTGRKIMKKTPYLKYYRLFNIENVYMTEECKKPIASKWAGYEPKVKPEKVLPINELEMQMDAAIDTYINKYSIDYKELPQNKAYYTPAFDSITMPKRSSFKGTIQFLFTKGHEAIHSTGHKSRLNRLDGAMMGKQSYSKEELVAEIGVIMLGCKYVGLENCPMDNSQAYINSWIKYLKDHKREVVSALSKATKGAEMIIGGAVQEEEQPKAAKNAKAPESTKELYKGVNSIPYTVEHNVWAWCVTKVNELRAAGKACDLYSILYEDGKKFAKIKMYQVAAK